MLGESSRSLELSTPSMPGKVLAITSGKGGVGKTTTTINLGIALWARGNTVALVDTDLGMANLAVSLGFDADPTLHDVLAGRTTLDDALLRAKEGEVTLLAGDRDLTAYPDATMEDLDPIINTLAENRDYVLLDCGAGRSYESLNPLQTADSIILVTTPGLPAIENTSKTQRLVQRIDTPIRGIVINRLRDEDPKPIVRQLGMDLLGTIPEDEAVTESTTQGQPLEKYAPASMAAEAFHTLAHRLDANKIPIETDTEIPVAETGVSNQNDPTGTPFLGIIGRLIP